MILNGIKLYPLNYVSLFLAILMTFACYTDEKLLKSQKSLSCDMIKLAMSRDIVAQVWPEEGESMAEKDVSCTEEEIVSDKLSLVKV